MAGRNINFDIAKDQLKISKIRGLIIDDDIIIESNASEVAIWIEEADQKGINITAPYVALKGTQKKAVYIMKDENGVRLAEVDEVKKMKPFTKIYATGLGFLYGTIDLNYRFHADEKKGEDEYFFVDQNYEVYHVPIRLSHYKYYPFSFYSESPS